MRLNYNAAMTHLENILAAVESIKDRSREMADDAMNHHRHPATHEDPAWFDSIGQSILDSAEEAERIAHFLEGWHEKVYDYTEGDGFNGINPRAFRWAYRQIKAAEEFM